MAKDVLVTAHKINQRKKTAKKAKIISILLLFFLTITFLILSLVYKGGKFVITLDPNSELETSLVLYEEKITKKEKENYMLKRCHLWTTFQLNGYQLI